MQHNQKQDMWPNGQHHQMWASDKKDQYSERAELNNRLKTMILNKQYQVS